MGNKTVREILEKIQAVGFRESMGYKAEIELNEAETEIDRIKRAEICGEIGLMIGARTSIIADKYGTELRIRIVEILTEARKAND